MPSKQVVCFASANSEDDACSMSSSSIPCRMDGCRGLDVVRSPEFVVAMYFAYS